MSLPAERPLLCVVTDRRRFGGDETVRQRGLLRQVAAAADAGIHLVQIRERDLPAGSLERLTAAAVSITRRSRTRIIVNERIDVAVAVGADGVHLRAAAPPSARVREMVPAGFLVGRSVHTVAEAAREGAEVAVDYLVLGTLFSTPSKPDLRPTGKVQELGDAVRATAVPILAIGGITERTMGEVARAGAAGVAAISYFMPELNDGDSPFSLADAATLARRLFDTSGSVI